MRTPTIKKGLLPADLGEQPSTGCFGGLSGLFWLGGTQGGFQLLEREPIVVYAKQLPIKAHVARKKASFFFDHVYYLVAVLSTREFLSLLEILNASSSDSTG